MGPSGPGWGRSALPVPDQFGGGPVPVKAGSSLAAQAGRAAGGPSARDEALDAPGDGGSVSSKTWARASESRSKPRVSWHLQDPVGLFEAGDLTRGLGRGLNLLQQTLPRPVGRPQPVAFVDRLPRPEPFRQVTPLHTGPHPVQNPADHLPVIPPPATTLVADRQEQPQPCPLRFCQVTPPHAHTATRTRGRRMFDRCNC